MEPDSFDTAAYEWLLREGRVLSYFGTSDVDAHLHLLSCGVDLEASGPVGVDVIESFSDTYSPPEQHRVVAGEAVCRCGAVRATVSHPPLSVSEIIDAAAATPPRDALEPLEVPDGVQMVVFTASSAVLRGALVPDPDDFDGPLLFAPLRGTGDQHTDAVPLAVAAAVFGAPQFVTLEVGA